MSGLMKDPFSREFLWLLERMLSTSPLAVLWTRVTEKMDLHVVLPTARHLINGIQNRIMRQLQRGAYLSNVVGTSPWWERERWGTAVYRTGHVRGEEEPYVLLKIRR